MCLKKCCRDQTGDGDVRVERSAGRAAAWLGHESLEPPPKSDLQTRLLRRHPSWEVLVGVVELLTGQVCVF